MPLLLIHTSLIAFITSIIGGIIPIRKNHGEHYKWMHHIDAFCDGMFIAIALTHLLPEIYEHSHHGTFGLYAGVIVAVVALMQRAIQNNTSGTKHIITYLLLAHCFVEGMAVSLVTNAQLQATLSITILAHKMIESFVFFNLLARQSWSKNALYLLLVVFSLLTPFGILCGKYITMLPESISILINALTCGAFLGIGINCYLSQSCHDHDHKGKIWLVLGFMALSLLLPMLHIGHSH